MSQNYCIKLKKIKPNDLTKHYYNCENIIHSYKLLVNSHRNVHRNLFLQLQSSSSSKIKLELFELEQARATRVLGTALSRNVQIPASSSSGVFRISVRRGRAPVGVKGVGRVWWRGPRNKIIFVPIISLGAL